MPEFPRKKIPKWKDSLLLAVERVGRQVYAAFPRLRACARQCQKRARLAAKVADRGELQQYLRQIGVAEGALVMAHTSATGLVLTEDGGQVSHIFPRVAGLLVSDLQTLLGPTGTLVMPTHALYQQDFEKLFARPDPIPFDPQQTPSGVGLANELFRRQPGVLRSLHPYNNLSARGPLAAELLHDNLNDAKPLPHGVHSGYYRFCRRNGLVISIGIPLRYCLTLMHVAEEILDQAWPIPDFFHERRYLIRRGGRDEEHVVRHEDAMYDSEYCYCVNKVTRDLIQAGILHEGIVGQVRVDWAPSQRVLEFLLERGKDSIYPYYRKFRLRKPWVRRSAPQG